MEYSIDQLLQAINDVETGVRTSYNSLNNSVYTENLSEEQLDESHEVVAQIKNSLSNVTYKDYNVFAFKQLIASIEHNGLSNFNMSTFLAFVDEDHMKHYDYIHQIMPSGLINYIDQETDNIFSKSTDSFNCTSVGCVAGFATAIAMNWQSPSWLKGDPREHYESFELIACAYLNIPVWVGKKIFYGEAGCVWAFAKQNSHFLGNAYQNIEFNNYDEEFEDDWSCYEVNLSSISYKDAVNLLNDVIEGRIIFDLNAPGSMKLNKQIACDRSVENV